MVVNKTTLTGNIQTNAALKFLLINSFPLYQIYVQPISKFIFIRYKNLLVYDKKEVKSPNVTPSSQKYNYRQWQL